MLKYEIQKSHNRSCAAATFPAPSVRPPELTKVLAVPNTQSVRGWVHAARVTNKKSGVGNPPTRKGLRNERVKNNHQIRT